MAVNCYPSTADWTCVPEGTQLDPEIKVRAEMFAWAALRALTGFQIANCPVMIRPCLARCRPGTWYVAPVVGDGYAGVYSGGTFSPHIVDGMWVNGCGCRNADSCSCENLSEVQLPGPIAEIVTVMVDGVLVPSSSYRVENTNRLVRTDGEAWPVCSDDFTVTYRQGYPIDQLINIAAGVLALEYFYACTSDSRCRLPSNVTTATRQGVTLEMLGSLFSTTETGIAEVDTVIAMLNPYRNRMAARVWSPDINRGRVRT